MPSESLQPTPMQGHAGLPPAISLPTCPVLPLRDIVVFPGMLLPLYIGRPISRRAVEAAQGGDGVVLLVTQKRAEEESPDLDGLYRIGTLARIVAWLPAGEVAGKLLVEGFARAALDRLDAAGPFFIAEATPLPDPPPEREAAGPSIAEQQALLENDDLTPAERLAALARLRG
jgi:ATP-dependent Lon protease